MNSSESVKRVDVKMNCVWMGMDGWMDGWMDGMMDGGGEASLGC